MRRSKSVRSYRLMAALNQRSAAKESLSPSMLLKQNSEMTDHCCSRMAADLNQACLEHADRSECPDALIDHVRGGYGIMIHDGGSSVIEIAFCPWCGAKLPPIGELDLSNLPADDPGVD